MSKLEELIEQLCPNGVERKSLGELGKFYGGLTGKSKDDFVDGNAKFITYKNVYTNPALDTDPIETVKIAEGEKQRVLVYGDIIFTGSSETPDECGFASVVTKQPKENLYLNSFCFFFRMDDVRTLNPDFAKHLFRCKDLRNQIGKTASGVTRFNVSKKLMEKVTIPIPPLPIQEEIVKILDAFTSLQAELQTELQAELQARKKQYEYYRDTLLDFGNDVPRVKLSEIAVYSKDRISASDVDENNYIGVDNLLQNKQGKTISTHVPSEGNLVRFHKNDVLIGNIRPYLRKIWFADCEGGTNGDVLTIQTTSDKILPQYLYVLLSSEDFFNYDTSNSKGAKMPRGDKEAVMRYMVSLPSIEEQERIVNILNRFDVICNDISSSLPAEIEARQKQYEYYRNKLLTFKELGA